jgi:pimeloyl-ACP methyl ester carboxylesterase
VTDHPLGASRWVLTRDGHPLHLRVAGHGEAGAASHGDPAAAGHGEPVVLFESGMGASSLAWATVAPAVAAHTTTVVYDRAGLGRSPESEGLRDLDHLADDLEDVLVSLRPDQSRPVILVGHSWGGPIIRTVAARRPDDVGGLVLVDQTDEGCVLHLESEGNRRDRILAKVYPTITRLGLMRPVLRQHARAMPRPLRDEYARTDGTPAAARALLREIAAFGTDLRRLHDHPLDPPTCAVTVISGTKPGRGEQRTRPALVAAHRARVASLTNGRWVEAAASGHTVMLTEPQIVIDEVLRCAQLAVLQRRSTLAK